MKSGTIDQSIKGISSFRERKEEKLSPRAKAMAESWDSGTRSTVQKLPLLTVRGTQEERGSGVDGVER